MSKYPLDREALVEEYGDLLIKIALKAYMKEQAQLLEQEEAEAAPIPAPKGNVVAAAFRQVNLEDAKETVLSGLKRASPASLWCCWLQPSPSPRHLRPLARLEPACSSMSSMSFVNTPICLPIPPSWWSSPVTAMMN